MTLDETTSLCPIYCVMTLLRYCRYCVIPELAFTSLRHRGRVPLETRALLDPLGELLALRRRQDGRDDRELVRAMIAGALRDAHALGAGDERLRVEAVALE